MKTTPRLIVGLAFAAALLGCNREPASDNAEAAARPNATVSAKSPEVDAALKRMVSGVSGGKDESIVELKFELMDRPLIDQPLSISIALLPKVPANTMSVTYISTDALAVQPVAVPAEYRDVQPGNIYRHELSVVPRDDGVYYVSAVVLLDSDTVSISRTFAIPILVGAPLDQAAPETKASADSPN